MKVLYIVPYICGYGGIARTLTTKANYMVRNFGYEVIFITLFADCPIVFDLDKQIRVIDLNLNPFKYKLFKRALLTLKLFVKIKKNVLQIAPDIIISLATVKETAWLWMMRDKSKKVLEVHGNFQFVFRYNSFTNRLSNFIIRLNINKSDAFITLTHRDANIYKSNQICIPKVIPNPTPFYPTKYASLNTKIVSCIGRLGYQKNMQSALRIWSKIHLQFPDWKLFIYGDGEKKQELFDIASELGITGTTKIEYATDMDKVYLNTSILIMTSIYEGLPMTLLEATSYGIPCISYDIDCGPSEVIEDGNSGYLIPPYDENCFAEKLSQLMSNFSIRLAMGKRAIEQSGKFNPDFVLKQWKELFEYLCNK